MNQTQTAAFTLLLYFLLRRDHIIRIYCIEFKLCTSSNALTVKNPVRLIHHIILNIAEVFLPVIISMSRAKRSAPSEKNGQNKNKSEEPFIKFIIQIKKALSLSPPNKLSSVKFLVCFNLQNASMLLKVCKIIVRVSNILDPGETPSYSASHPDPSCLHMA